MELLTMFPRMISFGTFSQFWQEVSTWNFFQVEQNKEPPLHCIQEFHPRSRERYRTSRDKQSPIHHLHFEVNHYRKVCCQALQWLVLMGRAHVQVTAGVSNRIAKDCRHGTACISDDTVLTKGHTLLYCSLLSLPLNHLTFLDTSWPGREWEAIRSTWLRVACSWLNFLRGFVQWDGFPWTSRTCHMREWEARRSICWLRSRLVVIEFLTMFSPMRSFPVNFVDTSGNAKPDVRLVDSAAHEIVFCVFFRQLHGHIGHRKWEARRFTCWLRSRLVVIELLTVIELLRFRPLRWFSVNFMDTSGKDCNKPNVRLVDSAAVWSWSNFWRCFLQWNIGALHGHVRKWETSCPPCWLRSQLVRWNFWQYFCFRRWEHFPSTSWTRHGLGRPNLLNPQSWSWSKLRQCTNEIVLRQLHGFRKCEGIFRLVDSAAVWSWSNIWRCFVQWEGFPWTSWTRQAGNEKPDVRLVDSAAVWSWSNFWWCFLRWDRFPSTSDSWMCHGMRSQLFDSVDFSAVLPWLTSCRCFLWWYFSVNFIDTSGNEKPDVWRVDSAEPPLQCIQEFHPRIRQRYRTWRDCSERSFTPLAFLSNHYGVLPGTAVIGLDGESPCPGDRWCLEPDS